MMVTSAAPSQPGSGRQHQRTAGYYRFTNSTGFSIGVPAGWQVSHDGHYVYIRDPANSGIFLLIDQSDQPQPNALGDWQQQAASRGSSYPSSWPCAMILLTSRECPPRPRGHRGTEGTEGRPN